MTISYGKYSEYVEKLNKLDKTWDTKYDDFFPYASGPDD